MSTKQNSAEAAKMTEAELSKRLERPGLPRKTAPQKQLEQLIMDIAYGINAGLNASLHCPIAHSGRGMSGPGLPGEVRNVRF